MSNKLNPDKALIFRITHKDNVPWILDNGIHCRNSNEFDPDFVNIGNLELIDKRQSRIIPIAPGGTLSDYIPFYFTPFSPMMYNIKTGWGGITSRSNNEIVILVSSLHKLSKDGIPFVFSDCHAYLQTAEFSSDLADLDKIDWTLLQSRNFKRSADDPGRVERYQAEALVRHNMSVDCLLGIVCYDDTVSQGFANMVDQRGIDLQVITKKSWYF